MFYFSFILVFAQKDLHVDIPDMLEDEIDWLTAYIPSEHVHLRETDNTLMAGHLALVKTLLTCDNVCKKQAGLYESGKIRRDPELCFQI